ncbi:MAG: VOC family protein [Acidimicrobiia bacterium]|nr:VOC family protein [Acidimicrobiia bacterium]
MASPIKFAHVVLKTTRYQEMLDWWLGVLEAEVRYGNDFLSFISYDDEHHRMAIAAIPGLGEADPSTVGVDHFAFTMSGLDDLFDLYDRLKATGVAPEWTVNHGMTLSAYYRDPDGNRVEFQVDICSLEEADEFMRGPLFAVNPIGVEADFEHLSARHRAGASFEEITEYVPVAG